MKIIDLGQHMILLLLLAGAALIWGGCFKKEINKTRGDLLAELAAAEKNYSRNRKDKTIFPYAKLHYRLGNFFKAKELMRSLSADNQFFLEAQNFRAELEYLCGNYETAADILEGILKDNADDPEIKTLTQVKLVFVYYQLNRYDQVRDFFAQGKIVLPMWELMKSFDSPPYQVSWTESGEGTEIPFVRTDPLPMLAVRINGREIHAIIDTGGDSFILDSEVAEELGIKPICQEAASGFAGGKQMIVKFAAADSLQIGGSTVRRVPIMILPTQRWSMIFPEEAPKINGVIGTQVLKQFFPTIDFLNKKLVLRAKSEKSVRNFHAENSGKPLTSIPFFMALTHYMIVNCGNLNRASNLTFFVDSGLADSSAAFAAPEQTLKYVNIPVPKLTQSGLGGGEDEFKAGHFDVDSLSMDHLIPISTKGVFGIMPKEWYRGFGERDAHDFIVDGLISHQYLKNFSWTLDFSSMTMIFGR